MNKLAYSGLLFQHTATRRWLQGFAYSVAKDIAFQHTATRRWLLITHIVDIAFQKFQHTATRRWLPVGLDFKAATKAVSTHSHPKVAAAKNHVFLLCAKVSTHSHPKVAASPPFYYVAHFAVSTHSHPKVAANTFSVQTHNDVSFNTQPPEGGCRISKRDKFPSMLVSTHSHPKVAAPYIKKQEKSAN